MWPPTDFQQRDQLFRKKNSTFVWGYNIVFPFFLLFFKCPLLFCVRLYIHLNKKKQLQVIRFLFVTDVCWEGVLLGWNTWRIIPVSTKLWIQKLLVQNFFRIPTFSAVSKKPMGRAIGVEDRARRAGERAVQRAKEGGGGGYGSWSWWISNFVAPQKSKKAPKRKGFVSVSKLSFFSLNSFFVFCFLRKRSVSS